MAAPTLVASYLPSGTTGGAGNWSSPATPKTASVTTATGDLLVTLAAGADGQVALTTPTGGTGVSWTNIADFGADGVSARATAFRSTPSAQTFTESITNTGPFNDTLQWSFITTRFSGSSGLGAPVATTSGGAAPSLSVTTTQANSGILVIIADWNAVAGTSYTYRQVNGANPTALVAGAGTAGNDYRVWVLWYADAGAAGAKTVGMTAPAGQTPTMIAIEVKGTSSGGATAVAATATAAAGVPTATGTSTGILASSAWSSPQAVTTGTASPVTAPAATATATARAPGALGVPLPMSGSAWSSPALVNTASANSPSLAVAATATATTTTAPVVTAERAVTGAGPGAGTARANAPVVAGSAAGSASVVAVAAIGSTALTPAPAVTVESVTTGGGPAVATVVAFGPQVTATSTVIGGVIDILAALAGALALPPIATGTTDTPPITEPVWLFSCPTHEEGIRFGGYGGSWLNHFRITRASSIYWNGSRWVSVRALNNDIIRTLEEGVTYFRGGSPYVITAATAQSLIAAGYAPILAT